MPSPQMVWKIWRAAEHAGWKPAKLDDSVVKLFEFVRAYEHERLTRRRPGRLVSNKPSTWELTREVEKLVREHLKKGQPLEQAVRELSSDLAVALARAILLGWDRNNEQHVRLTQAVAEGQQAAAQIYSNCLTEIRAWEERFKGDEILANTLGEVHNQEA